MKDNFAARDRADHFGRLSDGIANAIRTILDALNVLHAKQFDAPWHHPASPRDCTSR